MVRGESRPAELATARCRELEQSQRELRELVRSLYRRRECAEKRIAREVRDEIGMLLARLKMDLSLGGGAAEHAQELELVDQGIAAVQRISQALRPPALDDFGLVPAIEWSIEEFRRNTGIRVAAALDRRAVVTDPEVATALFRILQEALANAARHAQATLVVVRLRALGDVLRLTVVDNGVGVPPDRLCSPASTGLAGMRERGVAVGGTVTIRTGPTRGTTVTARAPLKEGSE